MNKMEPVKLIILGEPVGKQRPRKSFKLKGLYTPAETQRYEARVRSLAIMANKDVDIPLIVDIKAVFGVPKSYGKKKKLECLNGTIPPTKKPDKDNIEKIILDGLNPLSKVNKETHKRAEVIPGFYLDDKQVVGGETVKVYGNTPRVEVTIYPYGMSKEELRNSEVKEYESRQ